jgi:hypothetical protein
MIKAPTVDIMEFYTIEDDDYKKHYEVKDEQNNKTR